MPRALRTQVAGATYHVTAHAVAGTKLVRKDGDRRRLLAELTTVVDSCGWICLATCLLDNHYHLLVTTPEPNLARGMQRLNSAYATFFNNKYRRKGHLFGSRYYSGYIESEGHLLNTLRYIAWNAAAADPSLDPRTDLWNSYPGVVGAAECWPFIARREVLKHFGPESCAVAVLEDFVEGARAAA
jgi:Transposase and inactivated derivatives